MNIAILTVSDKGFRGERIDGSGPALKEYFEQLPNYQVIKLDIVPDEIDLIKEKILLFTDGLACDIVITTGGTGVAPRDVTPEATRSILDREIPGMAEAMRNGSMAITSTAMLSRAVCGIRGKSVIINLPGSPKGALECIRVVTPVLAHACDLINNRSGECAGKITR